MMKTRRKSKAATAAALDSEDAPSTDGSFSLAIPDDVDLETLSDLLPGTNLTSPSSDTIVTLYRLILAQALEGRSITQELDEARAEVEKKDVELDQALQDRESLSRELEGSVESLQSELTQVKQERDQLVASQTALQTQIDALSNSQSSSSTEVDALKRRVEDTEREKRDLVGVISRLKEESTQQEEEIQTLRANLKEARQEHQALEAQVRELRSTETSTKFKIDSLTQQLQLAQAEADRTNTELNSKAEEFSKYRRTKHAELTNLQAALDSITQSHASTQASLKSLQSSHAAQTHQLTQALARVQDLTGQLAEQEATYASEANGLRRLVAMMEEREKQAKDIVEGIEREWAGVGEKSERREAALKDEAERERRKREIAEKRAEQLEAVLDRMGRGDLPIPLSGSPGTPLRTPGTPDTMTDGMMGLSPTVAMASKAQRSGKTFTEVYADYVRLQEEYARKSAEYDHMDRTLSSVLGQIEERAPILSQQRAEYERLHSEASQLASQLAQALSERDNQGNLATENGQKLAKSTRENELLQKQLEDLGRQVQGLLREISRRDDPTIPSDEDLESIPVAPAEDTEAVITNNLVLFKSISGMQEQNQKLLKIVREMGRKMESEERDYREAMEKEQAEAIKEAHEAIQDIATQMERQKKSSEAVIQAYVKERDALRAMLTRVEKGGNTSAVNGISEQVQVNVSQTDASKELADIQSQFEAYRLEMGIDSGKLREDLIAAQREAGQLGAALAKANAKIEFLSDRHRMDQDQLAMHGRELDDLTKRNQQLYDQWTRTDIECSRATEDLQIASGRTEQLRNECANLRAEKKIWESVQGRLVDENKTLAMERSHLSDLMVNVQKMHNDLERSGENDRRRLESQLQMLEGQTQDLRTQVSQERDNVRHITLQKEIELKELQTRLDKNVQEFSKTREALVGAETSKKHLEERVDELAKQLQGNEEKLAVYERRTTAVNGVAQSHDPDMSREQQLEAEVAELRSVLKVTEVDLATARSHVQQFQEISQANETALSNLNATFDEYKASTEAQIARHESEYQALEEKLKAAQDELGALSANYIELQKTFETERNAWANDKKTLEDTIVDMSTSEKNSESDRTTRESEVRQQEERAKAAEERYSHEVIAHAESIKTIESLKRDLATSQATARDNLTTAETAKANLVASEASWKQQREALDKEVADLNARCQDLTSQNAILHQHLESVSSQANRIKAAAASSSTAPTETEATGDADTKLSELRSVVAYLRKEKEIVDLQLELSKQESSRLKAQIEHLSQSLEDTRRTLSEEREKAVETAASAAQHAELLERINQLNILRESNATLRADCESHAKRARELESKLKQLSQELDPAKEQARVAEAELQASKAQLTRQEEENRRWQQRNAQLLSKASLRDEIELLKSQKAEAEKQKRDIETASTERQELIETHLKRISSLEENLKNHKEHIAKNNNIFRTRMAEAGAQKTALTEEKNKLEAKVANLEQALAAAEKIAASSTISTDDATKQASTIAALQEERDQLLVEKAALAEKVSASGIAPSNWEAEKASLAQARDEALAKLKTAMEETHKATEEAKDFKRQSEKFQARITSLMKAKAAEQDRQAAAADAADKPKTEAQQSSTAAHEDALKRHAEELRALEAKLAAKHQEELKAAQEEARKEALNANPPAQDNRAEIDAAVAAAIAEHEKSIAATRSTEIEQAIERGRMEQVAKGKLKDSQLVKAQKKVKDLEAQILEWRKAGIIPELTAAPPTPTTAAASSSTPPAPASSTLPRKPSMAGTPTAPAGAGVGRGAPRGRVLQRAMGGAVGRGRGGAPTPTAPSAGGGMSIMGAAGKRPRESEAPEDSLAKRLKPAEPAASKPPVTIRRPAPGPS
nr:nucleoprotein MLP2 [Hypsizygus marmoreus]